MISLLRGAVRKGEVPWITVDVGGVGYEVQCTLSLWERVKEGEQAEVYTYTFVREDRLELFGFASLYERRLFMQLLDVPGIGPRTALQLTGVPANILLHAVTNDDARTLTALKGIGKKMAEKILVELKALAEKGILVPQADQEGEGMSPIDDDALEALTNLGYDRRSILTCLRAVPRSAKTTEERVKHVLQSL